ncbi:hypothetical protein [Roseivirga pacifica]|uniref:hypothetical protein n=1 Tax=Roseivirga pacifica TaxID=1267423 RepID=UPI00227AB2D8|nr:hypothetical protein [Roseivirga pacifica]
MASFIWTMSKDVSEFRFEYGKNFNDVRDSLGVPKVEDNWITHESSATYRLWAHPGRSLNTIDPIHFGKRSLLEDNKIVTEIDWFHYETDDSLAFRVVYNYHFEDRIWNCEFIKYRKEKFPPSESWQLTLAQADSTINKWGLSR